MSEFDVEKWLAVRKEAGLKINSEAAEVIWVYAQTLDPMGSIQTCPRNVNRSAVNISLGPRKATFGSASRTSRSKLTTLFGTSISLNWRFQPD
jgi:hypothetical protein